MSQNYTLFLKWQENSAQKLQVTSLIGGSVEVAARLMSGYDVVGENVVANHVRKPIRKFR